MAKYGPRPIHPAIRFWRFVDCSGEHWLWRGGKRGQYGAFTERYGHSVIASRYAYELTHGPIPLGFNILHACDIPACVRPEHLFIGTQKDNIADARRKGRLAIGKRNGYYTQPRRICRDPVTGRIRGTDWLAWFGRDEEETPDA